MRGLQAAATVLQLLFKDSPADLRFTRVKLLQAIRTFISKVAWQITISHKFLYRVCVCVFIPSPVRVGTLLSEVPGTPIGASFFEFELKPTGKDSADPTQHEFQHHIV